jgi:hypothetical protein
MVLDQQYASLEVHILMAYVEVLLFAPVGINSVQSQGNVLMVNRVHRDLVARLILFYTIMDGVINLLILNVLQVVA